MAVKVKQTSNNNILMKLSMFTTSYVKIPVASFIRLLISMFRNINNNITLANILVNILIITTSYISITAAGFIGLVFSEIKNIHFFKKTAKTKKKENTTTLGILLKISLTFFHITLLSKIIPLLVITPSTTAIETGSNILLGAVVISNAIFQLKRANDDLCYRLQKKALSLRSFPANLILFLQQMLTTGKTHMQINKNKKNNNSTNNLHIDTLVALNSIVIASICKLFLHTSTLLYTLALGASFYIVMAGIKYTSGIMESRKKRKSLDFLKSIPENTGNCMQLRLFLEQHHKKLKEVLRTRDLEEIQVYFLDKVFKPNHSSACKDHADQDELRLQERVLSNFWDCNILERLAKKEAVSSEVERERRNTIMLILQSMVNASINYQNVIIFTRQRGRDMGIINENIMKLLLDPISIESNYGPTISTRTLLLSMIYNHPKTRYLGTYNIIQDSHELLGKCKAKPGGTQLVYVSENDPVEIQAIKLIFWPNKPCGSNLLSCLLTLHNKSKYNKTSSPTEISYGRLQRELLDLHLEKIISAIYLDQKNILPFVEILVKENRLQDRLTNISRMNAQNQNRFAIILDKFATGNSIAKQIENDNPKALYQFYCNLKTIIGTQTTLLRSTFPTTFSVWLTKYFARQLLYIYRLNATLERIIESPKDLMPNEWKEKILAKRVELLVKAIENEKYNLSDDEHCQTSSITTYLFQIAENKMNKPELILPLFERLIATLNYTYMQNVISTIFTTRKAYDLCPSILDTYLKASIQHLPDSRLLGIDLYKIEAVLEQTRKMVSCYKSGGNHIALNTDLQKKYDLAIAKHLFSRYKPAKLLKYSRISIFHSPTFLMSCINIILNPETHQYVENINELAQFILKILTEQEDNQDLCNLLNEKNRQYPGFTTPSDQGSYERNSTEYEIKQKLQNLCNAANRNARRQQYNNRDSSSRPQNGGASSSHRPHDSGTSSSHRPRYDGASSSNNQTTQEQRYPEPKNDNEAINILNRFAIDKEVDIFTKSPTTKKVYFLVSKKVHPDKDNESSKEVATANFKVLVAAKGFLEFKDYYNTTPFKELITPNYNFSRRSQ